MNLTPRGTIAVALVGLVAIAGLWGEQPSFPWWRLVATVLVTGLAYEWWRTRGDPLHCSWLGPTRFNLGRPAEMTAELRNDSPIARNVIVAAVIPDGLAGQRPAQACTVPGITTRRLSFRLRPVELGRDFSLGLRARVRGPLGIAWWTLPGEQSARVSVEPDTLPGGTAVPGAIAVGRVAGAAPGRTAEFDHLRDYAPGDPRHLIDWKAVARTSKLVTRVFTDDQHLEIVLLIDAGRTSRTVLDGLSQYGHYVNLAARFAEHAAAGDDNVGVVVYSDRVLAATRPARGTASVRAIRKTLAGVGPEAREADTVAAALHLRRMVSRRCLVIVLSDLFEASVTSQLAQTTRLLVPKHLPLIVGLTGDETLRLAHQRASDWLDPYVGYAARDYMRTIDANVSRLARLGAHALTARPARVEAAVLARYRSLRARHQI